MAPVEAPTPAEEMTKAAQMAQEAQTVQMARTAQAAQMVQAAQLELPKTRAKRTAVGDVRAWTLAVLLLGVKSCAREERTRWRSRTRFDARRFLIVRAHTLRLVGSNFRLGFCVFQTRDGFTSLAFFRDQTKRYTLKLKDKAQTYKAALSTQC